jgi:hypothetical protein
MLTPWQARNQRLVNNAMPNAQIYPSGALDFTRVKWPARQGDPEEALNAKRFYPREII